MAGTGEGEAAVSLDSFDYLKPAGVTTDQMRDACVTLAGLSLVAADGDRQAAKKALRTALEAIGAIPYQPGAHRNRLGQVRP